MSLFQRLFVPFHVLVYQLSGGLLLGRLGGLPVLLLSTTGRRTGKSVHNARSSICRRTGRW